jgi:hypothetical protein
MYRVPWAREIKESLEHTSVLNLSEVKVTSGIIKFYNDCLFDINIRSLDYRRGIEYSLWREIFVESSLIYKKCLRIVSQDVMSVLPEIFGSARKNT